jgi:pimeloyl-ACP methyl ester carboxylesterase
MERIGSTDGVEVSFERYGAGPPLVLVHGSFSDHATNWQEARGLLAERYTVYAVARRGRGETTATEGHGIPDEARDVAAVLKTVPGGAFLLGHSYGAQTALAAAALVPEGVRTLVLYEPPYPSLASGIRPRLEALADRGDWDGLVETFMRDGLQVPDAEVTAIKASPVWRVWTADAPATLGDLRALAAYSFEPETFRALAVPVVFLVGGESPRELYATDALAAVLPQARVVTLDGQAHEGMTTAPEQFVATLDRILLSR